MLYCIYEITNLINGKIYIGQHATDDLDDGYMGSGTLIKRAIKKNGLENFTKRIIKICESKEEMQLIEAELVNEDFIRRGDTYNINLGGGFHYDCSLNPDSAIERKRRAKIRTTNKKRFPTGGPRTTPESAKKVGESMRKHFETHPAHFLGEKHTEETIEKVKKTFAEIEHQKGSKNSQFGTCWVIHFDHGGKKITKDDLPAYIENGWYQGRKLPIIPR